ncbi:putative two-component hybrid sensor and regulator, histidine kinase [Planktothrix sp. PCC 11201]|uniref:hybrid sensor histidine kinase/response regulator n=1 Tax=Planktothrix sp. PCC 11201 TaxID=1729650 RepID=UPI0009191C29|nr:ATP-binding protein [Planktothrix sp. PCC 11201]SKB12377.1 putative two-component hybrid sensor and regulator, histidine kinase [Planktothrix sp. PCC 11201]
MDDILYQQLQQERLLNQVTTQIRQSLDLSVILSTAVEQLRQFLLVDRLIIYQFNIKQPLELEDYTSDCDQEKQPDFIQKLNLDCFFGKVTYEARSSDQIISVLNTSEEQDCLKYGCNLQDKYYHGFIQSVSDIEDNYNNSPCFIEFLKQFQVQSILVLPIVVQQELWGLLIAHQCLEQRQWKTIEKRFLNQITQHLSIAIHQAELYAQVQQQKQTLEQRVLERTEALHDALLGAQSANVAKNQFLATMSHELRTPLTCVIGISATLLRYSGEKQVEKQLSPDKQRGYLKTIHDSGEKLLELINDILDLSQVEAGKTVLQISEFSLSKLANQVIKTFQEKAKNRQIELINEPQIKSNHNLFTGDYNRILQILFSLLENAIKFTPNGGKVTLKIRVDQNTVILQVKDTGIGIPDDQKSLLFEKFQQLNSSYDRQYGGAGLGLALTKQLVELHGGVIQFQSQVGVGSIFTVYLPSLPLNSKLSQDEIAPSPLKTSLPSVYLNFPHRKCVLIENDEETATLICDLLTAAGYQVVWLIEGFTAGQQIKLLQPDAVIINLHLAGQISYEILNQLQDKPETQKIKILALTHESSCPESKLYKNLENYDCLVKPIKPDELLNKLGYLV